MIYPFARSKPALPESAEESRDALRRRLVADFQCARYGLTFRTLAFPTRIAGESEYFKALATTADLDCWDVQKITDRDMQLKSSLYPVGTGNLKLQVVKSSLSFFEALEYLARFECAQTEPPVGPAKIELGNQHYEAFGLLHDIAFNMQGQPQPTVGGHIAINDEYPVTVLELLKDTQKKTDEKSRLATQTALIARADSEQIAADFLDIGRQTREYEALTEACKTVSLWMKLFQKILTSPDFRITQHERKGLDAYRMAAIPAPLIRKFTDFNPLPQRFTGLHQASCEHLTLLESLNPKDKALLLATFHEMTLLGLLENAKHLVKIKKAIPENKTLEAIERLAVEYVRLQGFSLKNKFNVFVAAALAEKPIRQLPPHLINFANQMNDLMAQKTKQVAKDWSLIQQLKP